jgi:hypothetical protein
MSAFDRALRMRLRCTFFAPELAIGFLLCRKARLHAGSRPTFRSTGKSYVGFCAASVSASGGVACLKAGDYDNQPSVNPWERNKTDDRLLQAGRHSENGPGAAQHKAYVSKKRGTTERLVRHRTGWQRFKCSLFAMAERTRPYRVTCCGRYPIALALRRHGREEYPSAVAATGRYMRKPLWRRRSVSFDTTRDRVPIRKRRRRGRTLGVCDQRFGVITSCLLCGLLWGLDCSASRRQLRSGRLR